MEEAAAKARMRFDMKRSEPYPIKYGQARCLIPLDSSVESS